MVDNLVLTLSIGETTVIPMDENAAKRGVKMLLKKLRGKGWKAQVWETPSRGWHYAATNDSHCMRVSPVYGLNRRLSFYAHLQPGWAAWGCDLRCFKDPNSAVRYTVNQASKYANLVADLYGRAKALTSK